ncbi:MAG: type II toxin-antitoxin system prevent-host-death family antitoxin [Desulfobacterales bacterium]|nr:type II toxin-antitoxin system prevent-host-death family antitoxin [Desulfobacterales bacterium]
MHKITIDTLQSNLNTIFNSILDDQEPVSVAVEDGREVVVLDAEDYSSIIETLHLLRSPANAERLYEGMRQNREGKKKEIEIREESKDYAAWLS